MKKIFIGDHELIIGSRKDIAMWKEFSSAKNPPSMAWLPKNPGRRDMELIYDFFNRYQKMPTSEILFNESGKTLEKAFFALYKLIKAAGGVVRNKEGKVLMMFRRGKWDLPKGKLDKGETVQHAAKREVIEETGIRKLKVISKIKFLYGQQDCTYHTYELNGKPIIKATYWFEMYSDDNGPLVPQTEEGITEVGWYSKKAIKEHFKNSYRSVQWVLNESGII